MDKTYDPKSFENRIYQKWMDKKYFSAKVNKNKKPFTIVIPPPNITGQLHIGHALDDTIQDSIIRYKRMSGFEALWIPGTDHASIATEVKIVDKIKKEEGLTKEQVGRDGFLARAYDWKEKFGGRIITQLKTMGFSCDWDRLAFTMDDNLSKAVREVFVNLYNKKLIYQGSRIINWCPDCKTALSDAEVEFEADEGFLWHIKYKIQGEDGFITVATTRPETMLGDTAVAVNPRDERYKNLIGKKLELPLVGRLIPIVGDDYVDKAFGTGAVKITPAHDPNDFEVGLRHNLEVIRVLTDDGVIVEGYGEYSGLERYKAREKIVSDLTEMGALEKIEKHNHNVGHCYRCHTVIEPLVSKQWFVKMQPLAEPAIKVVKDKETTFIPKRFEKIYLHWMENIKDWCISRQLWWGHRIPAFYCDECGYMEVSKEDLTVCPKCGKPMRQDEDVLDTWFSSALWPFSTLGYPNKTEDLDYFYPTSVLVTAYDIIFFWVARMIFSGIEHMGKTPFKEVLIHGIVRDDKGRKMSKSLGNGVDPLEIIDQYGADTLRFSLVNGISAGGDMKFSTDKLEGYRNFLNKIWNASRFALLNIDNVSIKEIETVKLTLADEWILFKLNQTTAAVIKDMDKYEVGLATSKLFEFIRNEFCDWYIELSKTGIYSDNTEKRENTVSVLMFVLRETLKLVHPIIPFITEEIYDSLPNKDAEDIMISPFPKVVKKLGSKAKADKMESVMTVIKNIRALRADMLVSQSKRTTIYISPSEGKEKLLRDCAQYIEKLASGKEIIFGKPSEKVATIVTDIAEVYIPFSELVDVSAERERLAKEVDTIKAEIARATSKLNNAGFVAKAPKELLAAEKEKKEKYEIKLQKTQAKLDELA